MDINNLCVCVRLYACSMKQFNWDANIAYIHEVMNAIRTVPSQTA